MIRRFVIRRLLAGRSVRAYPDTGSGPIRAACKSEPRGNVCPPVRQGGRSQGRLPGERRPTSRLPSRLDCRLDTDGDWSGQKVTGTVTPAAGRRATPSLELWHRDRGTVTVAERRPSPPPAFRAEPAALSESPGRFRHRRDSPGPVLAGSSPRTSLHDPA
jgi:hypothetical protein